MELDTLIYYKCTACSECFITEEIFFAHTRTWHCKILISEGHDSCVNAMMTSDMENSLNDNPVKTEALDEQPFQKQNDRPILYSMLITPAESVNSATLHTDTYKSEDSFSKSVDESDVEFLGVWNNSLMQRSDIGIPAANGDNYSDLFSADFSSHIHDSQQMSPRELPPASPPRTSSKPSYYYKLKHSDHHLQKCAKVTSKIRKSLPLQKTKGTKVESVPQGTIRQITGYECRVCQRVFQSKYLVRRHEQIHTNERPYVCNICEKRFLYSWHLKTHMLSHCKGRNAV